MRKRRTREQGSSLKHWQGAWRWIIPALIIATATWSISSLFWRSLPSEVLLAAIALLLGVAYFLQQQHIEQAKFFRELFTDFNRRYDELNDELLKGRDDQTRFNQKKFIDYFNLCAEEWLFYEAGYIDGRIWQAWRKGMRQFSDDPRVLELWQEERKTDSYYGFDFLRETQCDTEKEE